MGSPEPLPIIGKPEQFAADFFTRLEEKEKKKQKSLKRSKPHPVIDNEKPDPPNK